MKQLQNRNTVIVAIYAVTLIAVVFISKPEMEYSLPIRLALFGASMLPILYSPQYIIFSFTCLYTINSTSFCRLLPSDAYYYYLLIIAALFFCYKKKILQIRMLHCFIAILPFLLLSLVHYDPQNYQLWWTVCLLFIPLLDSEQRLKLLAFSFPIASFVLSLLYLFNQEYFLFDYAEDIERSGWINPNAFCGIIGVGIVIGYAMIFEQLKIVLSQSERILLIVCVSVSYVAIVLNASRGAFISSTFAIAMFTFISSNVKFRYKIIAVALVVLFAVQLWQSGYFELLTYRMEADTAGTAGNRSLIWTEKLNCFFENNSLLQVLFGAGGRSGAEAMGHTVGIQNMSTHNDFVTAIIGYGVPCFLYFTYMLLYPFLNAPKGHNRTIIGIITAFMIMESSVLEPFFRGYVAYIMLYIFLFSYSYYLKEQPLKS